jgi:hypothetical protein
MPAASRAGGCARAVGDAGRHCVGVAAVTRLRAAGGIPQARMTTRLAEHRTTHSHVEAPMPQKAWSDKRERQYEHIKDSYEDRGVSGDEAEERAARTVNKERAEHGETKAGKKRQS